MASSVSRALHAFFASPRLRGEVGPTERSEDRPGEGEHPHTAHLESSPPPAPRFPPPPPPPPPRGGDAYILSISRVPLTRLAALPLATLSPQAGRGKSPPRRVALHAARIGGG